MTMTMDTWKTKRTQWTKARDATPVKKGAVRGVSLGDGLDKVYKASAAGYRPLLAAIAAFEKDLKTYQSKGGKSVAPVSSWLGILDTDLGKLKAAARSDASNLSALGDYLTNFHQLSVPGIPDAGKLFGTREEFKIAKPPITWLEAAKRTHLYDALPEHKKKWEEVITRLGKWKFELALPGMDAHYAALGSLTKSYQNCYKHIVAFTKVAKSATSADAHIDLMKPASLDMQALDVKATAFETNLAKLIG